MLLGFPEYEAQARSLARLLGVGYGEVKIHYFPDGECKVTLPSGLAEQVILCRSLDRPNDKLIELLLAAKTARQQGVARLSLVAPYLCYMRQDTAFAPGEAVSQRIIGDFLAGLFDEVVTVDPHLHRTPVIADVFPGIRATALSAAPAMAEFLRDRDGALLLGPDRESEQWVHAMAELCGLEYGVATKQRLGDRDIRITLPDIDLQGKTVVIVDDVLSSGKTIAIAAQQCLGKGAARVDVMVTHALFAPGAMENLKAAGVGEIWSTDSIGHETNVIALSGLLCSALQQHMP